MGIVVADADHVGLGLVHWLAATIRGGLDITALDHCGSLTGFVADQPPISFDAYLGPWRSRRKRTDLDDELPRGESGTPDEP